MEITVANLFGIVSQSIVFGAVGAIIATTNVFLERKKGRKLAVDTVYIQTDKTLLVLCSELQAETRDKNVAITEYGQLIRAIDQLVGLQFDLQQMYMKSTDEKEFK